MVAAVVGGVRPATDWPGDVVVTADQAGRVHVEGLSLGVGVDVGREADVEASPLFTCLRPGIALGEGDPFVREKDGRREVVPPCIAGEVRGIESVPAEVATESAEASERGAGIASALDQLAVAGLDPNIASIEHRSLVLFREAVKDGVLFCRLHPHGHVGHSVSREARAQEAAERPVDGEGGHGPPPLKAAVGGEDLVEQPAQV